MSDDIRDFVQRRLVSVLSEIQRSAGRELPPISDETIPLDHLPGFDSLNGVEASVLLSEQLGLEIEEMTFIAPQSGRRLTIREATDDVVQRYGARIGGKGSGAAAEPTSSLGPSGA